MNERIRELAKRAEEFSHWSNDGCIANYRINPEKFAELIVRECIYYAFCHGDDIEYVKKHFGVV
jgi:hypothetical protein